MKVINLFGGPGVGKSTAAAGLFYEMKKRQMRVELVTEYAKDLVWEQRWNVLEDQLYILGKQHRRIARLAEHGIDYVITDSPIALGLVYLKPGTLPDHFLLLTMEVFGKFDNLNFLLARNFPYDPVGRAQKDIDEARLFDLKVTALLDQFQVDFTRIPGGEQAVHHIIQVINGSTEEKLP